MSPRNVKSIVGDFLDSIALKRDVTNIGKGKRRMANEERGTGNGERETENGKRETGNGSLGPSVQQ